MDDAFGHWLAGFADGEGCFVIAEQNGRYRCAFMISVRADERPIVDEIVRRTGLGWTRFHAPRASQPNAGPAIHWRVTDKAGCLAVVDLFDRYPLRAKKKRDFAIWREAVARWAEVERSNGATPERNANNARVWHDLAVMHDALRAARVYQEAA